MASHQVLEQRGLMGANNETTLPKGAMVQASNVVNRHAGIIEPRRGDKFVGQSLGSPAAHTFGADGDRTSAGSFFGSTPVARYGSKLAKYSGGAFSDFTGSFTAPDDTQQRTKFVEFAQSLLFTTSLGPYILDSITGTPVAVGVPRAWDFQRDECGITGDPGDGWMSPDGQVAYRVVWALKDANGRIKKGEPSGRCIVHNPRDIVAAIGSITIVGDGSVFVDTTEEHGFEAGDTFTVSPGETGIAAGTEAVDAATPPTSSRFYWSGGGAPPAGVSTVEQTISSGLKNVALRVRIPKQGITTAHFFQVFRSHQSATQTTPPDDELFQVYEGTITSGDITAGYIDFTDKTPETLLNLGAPLYTNANTGDGLDSANAQPVIGRDMCVWDDRVWLFNTTERHTFHLQLLGVGSPDGVQDGDTITLGALATGATFTAKNAPSGSDDFLIHAIDTPAKNIERTAQNLCDVINQNEDIDVWAFYESGPNDVPGKILLIERAIGGAAHVVYASRTTSWNPPLTTSSTGAQQSDNARRKNGMAYSKRYEPDHWPRYNYEEAGAANWELLRGVPLKDKLFCFPQAGGIFTASGQAPYVVKNVDESACLIAPDTAVVHNNQVYALTTQGFVSIGDGGVRLLSEDIKDELDAAVASLGSVLKRYAFCVSYEAERQVELWLPSSAVETSCTTCFVFNSLNETWTKRTGDRTWGAIHPTEGKRYMGDGSKNSLRVERKDFARTDYADESLAVTIDNVVGNVITLVDATGVSVGDVLWQSATQHGLITDKTDDQLTVTTPPSPWSDGDPAQVEIGFTAQARYAAANPGGPDLLKKFVDCTFHFRRFFSKLFTVLFTSDLINGTGTRTKGSSDYDTSAVQLYGVLSEEGPFNVPFEVPQNATECTQLRVGFSIREAWGVWALNGHTLTYQPISDTKGSR